MTVQHTIYIEASPDVVWEVTEDIEQWPAWTPTVTSVTRAGEGALGVGSVARIKQPGQPEAEWTVTEFVPNERFSWGTRRPGMKMAAAHVLTPEGTGTMNLLQVEVTGILAVLLWPVLRVAVQRALTQENQGLKARCEAR